MWFSGDETSAILWTGLLALRLGFWWHHLLGLTGLSLSELLNTNQQFVNVCILKVSALHDALVWLEIDQSLQDQRTIPPWLKHGRLGLLC